LRSGESAEVASKYRADKDKRVKNGGN